MVARFRRAVTPIFQVWPVPVSASILERAISPSDRAGKVVVSLVAITRVLEAEQEIPVLRRQRPIRRAVERPGLDTHPTGSGVDDYSRNAALRGPGAIEYSNPVVMSTIMVLCTLTNKDGQGMIPSCVPVSASKCHTQIVTVKFMTASNNEERLHVRQSRRFGNSLDRTLRPERLVGDAIESHLHEGHSHSGSTTTGPSTAPGETHFASASCARFREPSRIQRPPRRNQTCSRMNSTAAFTPMAIEASAPGETTRR